MLNNNEPKILVFDDDFQSMYPLKLFMEMRGYIVELTASADVLRQLQTDKFDLIFIDDMIHPTSPDEYGNEVQNVHFDGVHWTHTGKEFVKRIRKGDYYFGPDSTPIDVPIVVVSGIADPGSYGLQYNQVLTDVAKGPNACIEKPFDIEQLLNLVKSLVSKQNKETLVNSASHPYQADDDLPSTGQPRYNSCFISHSNKDQDFADRLHADLQAKGVRCWYAPEEMKGGRKIHEQIDEAIRVYDKLLLVLSEHSMNSEWVQTEIYNARQQELRENRRKLFPIALVDFDAIRQWRAFDADSGKDMGREVREYFIPDFSRWKDHDSYQKAFDRLLADLRAST